MTSLCKAAGSEGSKSVIQGEAEAGLRFPPLTLRSAWLSPLFPDTCPLGYGFPFLCLLHHLWYLPLFTFQYLPFSKVYLHLCSGFFSASVIFLPRMAGVLLYTPSLSFIWFLPFCLKNSNISIILNFISPVFLAIILFLLSSWVYITHHLLVSFTFKPFPLILTLQSGFLLFLFFSLPKLYTRTPKHQLINFETRS